MANAKPTPGNKDVVAWVGFEDSAAVLKRIEVPGTARGLLLRISDGERSAELRQKALDFGFGELKANGLMRRIFMDGKIPFTVKEIAAGLGGKPFLLDRKDLLSNDWTVRLAPASKDAEKNSRQPKPVMPDPDTVRTIGLNMRGEDVVRDGSGRFFRKVNKESGVSNYIAESATEQATLFLRAQNRGDLPAIAAGLVNMAGRGTLHESDFNRVMDAALEEGPAGRFDIDPAEARNIVRSDMLRQVANIGLENDASRDKFILALRVATNAGAVLDAQPATGSEFAVTTDFQIFMRRITRSHSSVSFRGGDDLALSLPRSRNDEAQLQVQDLSDMDPADITAYAMNALTRRPDDGNAVLILSGIPGEDAIERFRTEVGVNYALEAVAEIDGGHTAMMIGSRRPEPLEQLPQAAMRTFRVVTSDDYMNLEREINRSRNRIKDFHAGVRQEEIENDDDRVDNVRQRPYRPLSKVTEPFTMIPVSLEGATIGAMKEASYKFEDRGGIDAVVAESLGVSIEGLGEILNAEQVDAIGMRMARAEDDRGFLCADQTGVGKGRTLAAIARGHIRAAEGNRVLYFTESANINVPDVCRDLLAVGAFNEGGIAFLTSGSQFKYVQKDPVSGKDVEHEINSYKPGERKAIMESGVWPEDVKVLITTYSMFNSAEGDPRSDWLLDALDERVMIVTDEAHNGLNPKSRTGRNIRAAYEQIERGNSIFGTATPSRDPKGMSLYTSLLPKVEEGRLDTLLTNMAAGGEVAQEAFASMIAADGAMIRRDHDLSNIEFRVNLPEDAKMLEYQSIMNRFSPVVEMMIESSSLISAHTRRRQAIEYEAAIDAGLSQQAARARTNELNQYSIGLGSPLSNLARITMNAVKIDQVVESAMDEIREGRKPLITFHSTNAALLNEMARGEDGKLSEAAMENVGRLSLKDQIRRIHNAMYRTKMDGEQVDSREMYLDVAESARMIEDLIDALPDDLPVSPVDALVERLEANGVGVGEISGRTLCYRDSKIQKRQGRNRRETIDAFNSGDLDVLIYNSAGATGGSYHASKDFKDSRPRTMIELETPTDIIKYAQSQGRGNRYGQVHNPRIISVMTGLTPEMRILQQRNKKLRSLGASVDGNRSHPLLLDDVPDLLNKVGDESTRNVLMSMPSLARRLGFPEYADTPDEVMNAVLDDENDTGSGAVGAGAESLANKVLTRSIMLSAKDQDDLVKRIMLEFESLIEELDSRNSNPLKPKELKGRVEIKATALFSGQETEDDQTSAFLAPLYISTGIHHFDEEAYNGEKVLTAIDDCRRLYGSDGFRPWAERITQNIPILMRSVLPEGMSMEDALENPGAAGSRFSKVHEKYTNMAWLLENMIPGVGMRAPLGSDTFVARIIVGLVPPKDPSHFDMMSAYKIDTIRPGDSQPERISLSRIMTVASANMENIIFRPAFSIGADENRMKDFDRMAQMTRQAPVQIMHGNILEAISTAETHRLGSVSLYRDNDGHVHRGIVVPRDKVNLKHLPVSIPSAQVAAEIAYRHMNGERVGERKICRLWGNMSSGSGTTEFEKADISIKVTPTRVIFDMIPLRKSSYKWYADRPGLFEAIFDKEMPARKDVTNRPTRRVGSRNHSGYAEISLRTAEGMERAYEAIRSISGTPMMTEGFMRDITNDVITNIERVMRDDKRGFTVNGSAEDVTDDELNAEPEIARVNDEIPAVIADEEGVAPEVREEAPEPVAVDVDVPEADPEEQELRWG